MLCVCMAVTVGHVARLALTTDTSAHAAHGRSLALAHHACARHATACSLCLCLLTLRIAYTTILTNRFMSPVRR
jgi:hypothetical protein